MAKENSGIPKLLIVILIVIAVAVGGFFFYKFQEQQKLAEINTYEECVTAGFPVMESYPPQCRVANKSFTQDIGNEMQYQDEIRVESPRPNQKIAFPVEVKGEARGNWFFEASFSGELFDADGRPLGNVILQAEGEWMTKDFVPFSGELHFKTPQGQKGKLVIRNSNPSGMEENQKELTIPVTF